ncbi:hypothetical protein [Nocardioides sp.]|uniref:Putative lipoprotein n=1 Tax=metagenome TaxID=256318 RepID=A0A2P2C0U7_9ZZZZ
MRTISLIASATLGASLLAGCGSSDPVSPPSTSPASASPSPSDADASASPTPSETPSETNNDRPTVDITIKGDSVKPQGVLVEAELNAPVVLNFTSDRSGELHVHSKPEQVVEFGRGTSTQELIIKTPGIVDIEDHESGIVIAQLEVK